MIKFNFGTTIGLKNKTLPMKKLTFVFVLVILFISCKERESSMPNGNNFYFENPQPINDSELSSIPNKYHGIYMNSDSIYLNIAKSIVFTECIRKFKLHKNQLDSLKQDFDIVKDKYILKESKEIFDYKLIGDSIQLSSKSVDTIFVFSNAQKAKRINGYLILNQKDSILWKVNLVSLNKNKLIIRELYSNDDLKKMDSITKIHSKIIDSTSFIISPSRREFSKFLELKNFGFEHEYRKISN